MVSALFTDTVVIVRPATATDRYGNTVADPDSTDTRTTLEGVSVQPDRQVETDDGTRISTDTRWVLRNPIDAGDLDITATDQIEYAGMTLDVDGDILRFPGLLEQGVSCVQVWLRRRVDL